MLNMQKNIIAALSVFVWGLSQAQYLFIQSSLIHFVFRLHAVRTMTCTLKHSQTWKQILVSLHSFHLECHKTLRRVDKSPARM